MAGLIPQAFIDELIARADIVDLIGRHVRLKRQGREFAALCPFHQEKSPSFTVSPQKQFFHCFGCGAHGTALGFLMRYEHLDFVQAVERLADDLGLDVPRAGGEANPHGAIFEVLSRAQQFYAAELPRSSRAQAYLRERALTPEAVETYGIGYASGSGDALVGALAAAGVDEKLTAGAGLSSSGPRGSYDRFRDRLMLPIRDSRGRTVAFGGRAIGEGAPKYLNSPETPVFHKGRMLYGLYEARRRERRLDRLVVVEGYLDVTALAIAGFGAAVATLGTAVTEAQIELLFRTGAREVIFCFDGDAAGTKAAWRALEQTLPALAPEREVRFAFLPAGQDPDSLVREAGLAIFERTLEEATPLSVYLLDKLASEGLEAAEGRARFAGALRPLLGRIRDELFREALLAAAAERLQMPLERLAKVLRPGSRASERNPRPVRSGARFGQPDARVIQVLRLALAAPPIAASVPWPRRLQTLELPGMELLARVIETLHENPHLTTAGLLEHWRERPEAPFLGRLAAHERLIEDDESVAAEYRGALGVLETASRDAEIRRLDEISAGRELDAAERERLQTLLGKAGD